MISRPHDAAAAALLQIVQTLSDELLTVTSTVPGSGVTAPDPTGVLTMLGPDTLDLDIDLDKIPVIGPIIDTLNNTIIPGINGASTDAVDATNTAIGVANTAINGLSNVINDTVNPFTNAIDSVASTFGPPTIDDVTVNIPSAPTIPTSDISSIPAIDPRVNNTFSLPDVAELGVPAYTYDIANNDMAILGSIAALATGQSAARRPATSSPTTR